MQTKIDTESKEYLSSIQKLKNLQEKVERMDLEYKNQPLREPSPIRTKTQAHSTDWFQEYKEKGNQFFKSQDFIKAIEYYDKSLTYKQDPTLYTNKAVANIKLKKFVEAEQDCENALTLDPVNAKAYLRRGLARRELKKYLLALSDLEKVLELIPDNKEAQEMIPTMIKTLSAKDLERYLSTKKLEQQKSTTPKIVPLTTHEIPVEKISPQKVEIKKKEPEKTPEMEIKVIKSSKGVKIPTNPPETIFEFEQIFRELKDHGFEDYLKFKLFVQVGRVAQFTSEKNNCKLIVILDIIDQNRVLVDGPGVKKQEANLKDLNLLPFVLEGVTNTSTSEAFRKAWEAAKVEEKFAATKVAKVQKQKEIRAKNSDFDRFVVATLKKQRNAIVNAEFKTLSAKHAEAEEKRLAPHKALLAKIEKNKKMIVKKNAKKLARKICKRGQVAASKAKADKVEKWKKENPDKKDKYTKKTEKAKRTPNRQRKSKDEPARLKRKALGEKKLATKLSSKPKVTKQKAPRPKAKKTETK